jgi:hypothetical protein
MISSVALQEDLSKHLEGCYLPPPAATSSANVLCQLIQVQINREQNNLLHPKIIEKKLQEVQKQIYENLKQEQALQDQEENLSKTQVARSTLNIITSSLSFALAAAIGGSIPLCIAGTCGISAELIKPLNEKYQFLSPATASYMQITVQAISSLAIIITMTTLAIRPSLLTFASHVKDIASGALNFKTSLSETKLSEQKAIHTLSDHALEQKQLNVDSAMQDLQNAIKATNSMTKTIAKIIKTSYLNKEE